MKSFVFHNPVKILFGIGMAEKLAEQMTPFGKNVLVVLGGESARKSGLYDTVIGQLKRAGCAVTELWGVKPNPRVDSVREGVSLCKRDKVDFVLGVGGGSVIDCAKAIAAGAKADHDVWDFYSGKRKIGDALPLGCVLTLAATGTEMNANTVITNLETGEKIGISSGHLLPRFSVLDPALTCSVDAKNTAYGCVDIMAHVFEQYFNNTGASDVQDRLSEAVLLAVRENAPRAIADPGDIDARANIMWAGTLALNGLLSAGIDGDWASHGIEHELSAAYDVPHGAGLAVVFPAWMSHVLDTNPARFAQYATRVWGIGLEGKTEAEAGREGIAATKRFFASLGAPVTMAGLKIDPSRYEEMARKAVGGGSIGKFRKLGAKDVEAIFSLAE